MEHQWHEQVAANYLKDTYFSETPSESLAWKADRILFSGHWSGILGTRPGSACGNQPMEAFHSSWQGQVEATTRQNVRCVYEETQKLFSDSRSTKFSWGTTPEFSAYPKHVNDHLSNSASLRAAGRSCAVDFWDQRAKPNHVYMVRDTSSC